MSTLPNAPPAAQPGNKPFGQPPSLSRPPPANKPPAPAPITGTSIAGWLGALVISVLLVSANVLDQDPEALQDVADDVAAVGEDMRYDVALTAMGKQRP